MGPLLSDVSRLDNNGLNESNSVANQIKQQLAAGKFAEATDSFDQLQDVISQNSDDVTKLRGNRTYHYRREVDQLLAHGVNVTIYNGQNSQKASIDWFFRSWTIKVLVREIHICTLLSINVPLDQPCTALDMIANITQSPPDLC
ncbi:retinoid-inducible serine carboxypeptidase [Striga asiatica]|uniref:Retinoid-inducible serine carboxypeptidase n=1 Tax=Striga asiatica TaxID=4170 RepID=A0A5A7Q5J2_STRAF|nr:retinoid-inducible serine carboxypeptidase [Striga asiatica]